MHVSVNVNDQSLNQASQSVTLHTGSNLLPITQLVLGVRKFSDRDEESGNYNKNNPTNAD